MTRDGFNVWADAVKAACAEAGCPMLIFRYDLGDEGATYGWAPAGNRIRQAEQWESDVFHRACLLAEPLRPEWLQPSPLLASLLEDAS